MLLGAAHTSLPVPSAHSAELPYAHWGPLVRVRRVM